MSDTAFDTAQKIMQAIEKKLVKYKGYVRMIEAANGYSYFEIAMRPPGGTHTDEITVAYSVEFFAEATPETLKPKAIRILNEFRTLLGLPRE